mmetsp:Transcript_6319/g.17896  ORF Transcript_6319/g.17896 Transcript_6319/m.17896 type:complete len:314 (-) Transcript_6319:75-1016(-)
MTDDIGWREAADRFTVIQNPKAVVLGLHELGQGVLERCRGGHADDLARLLVVLLEILDYGKAEERETRRGEAGDVLVREVGDGDAVRVHDAEPRDIAFVARQDRARQGGGVRAGHDAALDKSCILKSLTPDAFKAGMVEVLLHVLHQCRRGHNVRNVPLPGLHEDLADATRKERRRFQQLVVRAAADVVTLQLHNTFFPKQLPHRLVAEVRRFLQILVPSHLLVFILEQELRRPLLDVHHHIPRMQHPHEPMLLVNHWGRLDSALRQDFCRFVDGDVRPDRLDLVGSPRGKQEPLHLHVPEKVLCLCHVSSLY